MNRATIAGIVEDDAVLSAGPIGEQTLLMRVAVPGMARGETGSIAVRQYGEAATRAAEQLTAGSGVLVDGRVSHMAAGSQDQHYEVVGLTQPLRVEQVDGEPTVAVASNRVAFTGRLTQDPELRSTPNGTSVCRMRLAVDGMGAAGRDAAGRDAAGFINVTEFGKPGEASARRLGKGWLVAFDGRLDHQTWEKDGQERETHGVIGRVEHLAPPRASGDRERELDADRQQETTVDPREPGSASRTATPGLPGAATEQLISAGAGVEDDIAF
jgi:single stranded DNA-binding protein